MAHFKRGKCRYHGKGRRSSETFYRKRHGLKPIKTPEWPVWGTIAYYKFLGERDKLWPAEFSMMGNWPRWHDILHHTRRRRARTKALECKLLKDHNQADGMVWPLAKKPHIYYW